MLQELIHPRRRDVGLRDVGLRDICRPYIWRCLMLLSVSACFCPAQEIRLDGWTALVDPATLSIRMRIGSEEILLASGSTRLSDLGLTARLTPKGRRLHIRIESGKEQSFDWPRTGVDSQLKALILPEGEGLFLPMGDATWRRRVAGRCYSAHGNLSLPIWAFQAGSRTITYHSPTDIRTELCLEDRNKRLEAVARHQFLDRDHRPAYEVEIWPGGASPIDPAREYRAGVQIPTLRDKMKANPGLEKLMGAIHMYVWGDGRSKEFLTDLQKAGVKRAWIGYDQNPTTEKHLVDKVFLDNAKAAGYLAGPYDTYNNAQDPKTGEDYVSRWPGTIFPDGCVASSDRKPLKGFAGRGCELSSEALELRGRKPIAERLDEQLRQGPNSYFLDVDAYGELHDDFSPAHPMTQHKDRDNRLARMRDIRARGIVFGSEHGAAWAVPVIDFGHGSLSVQNQVLWSLGKQLGGWWPAERPAKFFRPVEAGAEFASAKFNPVFRIPLYEAAFHDAVVSTDRWDLPMAKFPSLTKSRLLLELLYGSPSIWAMDRRQLREHASLLSKLAAFFELLHREIGPQPLTSFEWLTADGLVQRTRFGRDVTVTANFGTALYQSADTGVNGGCVEAKSAQATRAFCPFQTEPVR